MRLYLPTESSLKEMPLLVIEVFADKNTSTNDVPSHGIIHSERIKYLSKVYVLEPSLKQVVVAWDLHVVSLSNVLPSVPVLYTAVCVPVP